MNNKIKATLITTGIMIALCAYITMLCLYTINTLLVTLGFLVYHMLKIIATAVYTDIKDSLDLKDNLNDKSDC